MPVHQESRLPAVAGAYKAAFRYRSVQADMQRRGMETRIYKRRLPVSSQENN